MPTTPLFQCKACQSPHAKAVPHCNVCNKWHTVAKVDDLPNLFPPQQKLLRAGNLRSIPITELPETEELERFSTGTPALDHVLGGGLVPGTIIIISGPPGIGKSTLLLRIAADIANENGEHTKTVLYGAGEEGTAGIGRRATRIEALSDELHLLDTQDFSLIEAEVMKLRPDVLIVDSLNRMRTDRKGKPGHAGEMNRLADRIMRLVKKTGGRLAVFIVLHVTKDGEISGPESVQHDFDATLLFEETGSLRTLRATKNREGVEASALFEMTKRGVEAVNNPSERFLSDRIAGRPGSVVSALCDGKSRIAKTTLFEVQALVGKPKPKSLGKVSSNGVDKDRLTQILEVLDHALEEAFPGGKHMLALRDVRVNIPGGLDAKEPSVDLPIALAIASSLLDIPVNETAIAFGEIGLVGEIRAVYRTEPRIQEAQNMGFAIAIAPRASAPEEEMEIEVLEIETLADALLVALAPPEKPKTKKVTKKKAGKRS